MLKTYTMMGQIGTFEFTPTGYGISVRCNNATVRGVLYYVGLHGKKNGDVYDISTSRDEVHIRRPDKKFNNDQPSDSARAVIMDAAAVILAQFVKHYANDILAAERQRLIEKCQGAANRIIDFRKAVQDAEAEWEAAKVALDQFDTTTGYGEKWHDPA